MMPRAIQSQDIIETEKIPTNEKSRIDKEKCREMADIESKLRKSLILKTRLSSLALLLSIAAIICIVGFIFFPTPVARCKCGYVWTTFSSGNYCPKCGRSIDSATPISFENSKTGESVVKAYRIKEKLVSLEVNKTNFYIEVFTVSFILAITECIIFTIAIEKIWKNTYTELIEQYPNEAEYYKKAHHYDSKE